MSKKKERRRHRRRAAGEAAAPPPPPRGTPEQSRTRSISWTGLLGALSGILALSAVAADIIVTPPEDVGATLAAVPIAMAALYTPAVWASVVRTEARQSILRGSVVASLAMAFTGSLVFGFVTLVILLPATALLWIASGGLRPARA
jgi:hypothetical protein